MHNRDQLDELWHQALQESVKAGEPYARYHFAALIAEAERERCAEVCEELAKRPEPDDCCYNTATQCAAAIRARSNHD